MLIYQFETNKQRLKSNTEPLLAGFHK